MFKCSQAEIIHSPRVIGGLLQTPAPIPRAGKVVRHAIEHRFIHRRLASTNAMTAIQPLSRKPTTAIEQSLSMQPQRLPTLEGIATQASLDSSLRSQFSTGATTANDPAIHTLYEPRTGTWQYVVSDPSTKAAVIIDPVLDYDPTNQMIATETADSILSLVKEKGLRVEKILETHVHADHITAASYLQNRLAKEQDHRPPVCIGKRIVQVQQWFGQKYQIPAEEYESAFDKLLDDDEIFSLGELTVTALHLPGHTPDHMGYMIGGEAYPTLPN